MKAAVICAAVGVIGSTGIGVFGSSDGAQADDEVTFAIIGDFGSGSDSERRVAELVGSWNPSFVTTTGDNVYSAETAAGWTALENKVGEFYHDYIYPYRGNRGPGSPTGTNRFFPALGNHDWGDPGTPLLTCEDQNCSGAWLEYFELPGNGRYYDYRDGPVHIFVLDDYYLEPDGHFADSTQADWLRATMGASDAPWKIVLTHFAPFQSTNGGHRSIQWPFAEWGASMVVSGHSHLYERLEINGLTYVVNGLGGAGGSPIRGHLDGSKVQYNAEYGAMRLVATDSQLISEFINTSGEVVDRAVLVDPTTSSSDDQAPEVTTPYVGASGRQGSLVRLYRAAFGRLPDENGLGYWDESGLTLTEVAHQFLMSEEFQQRYGQPDHEQFLAVLYNNVLGREPDPAGLAYWRDLLDSGQTRLVVLLGFSESAEFRTRTGTS